MALKIDVKNNPTLLSNEKNQMIREFEHIFKNLNKDIDILFVILKDKLNTNTLPEEFNKQIASGRRIRMGESIDEDVNPMGDYLSGGIFDIYIRK